MYKDGRYQYVSDIDKVSKAQKDLSQYQADLEVKRRIEAIEKERDAINDRRKALEDERKEIEKGRESLEEKRESLDDERRAIEENREALRDQRDALEENRKAIEENREALRDKRNELEEGRKALERERALEIQVHSDRIKEYNDYKDQWSDLTSAYEREQDRLLIAEKLGIDIENDNWEERLDNANDFKREYISIMNQIARKQEEIANAQEELQKQMESPDWSKLWWDVENNPNLSQSEKKSQQEYIHSQKEKEMAGSGMTFNPGNGKWESGSSGWYDNWGNAGTSSSGPDQSIINQAKREFEDAQRRGDQAGMDRAHAKAEAERAKGGYSGGADGSQHIGVRVDPVSGQVFNPSTGKWSSSSSKRRYASGTYSASGGLAYVGENGTELRVLNRGDGIIPAEQTKNLWEWGSMKPSDFVNSINPTVEHGDNVMPVTIQNINLPSVKDGHDFVDYLKNNLFNQTMQLAHNMS